MPKLTSADRAVLRQAPITEAQLTTEREREEAEAARMAADAKRDGEGLSAADRAFLRANPAIDRAAFIAERRKEIEAAGR